MDKRSRAKIIIGFLLAAVMPIMALCYVTVSRSARKGSFGFGTVTLVNGPFRPFLPRKIEFSYDSNVQRFALHESPIYPPLSWRPALNINSPTLPFLPGPAPLPAQPILRRVQTQGR